MIRLGLASLFAVVLLAACGTSSSNQCTLSSDCGSKSFICEKGSCVSLNDGSSGDGDEQAAATSTGAGGGTGAGGASTSSTGAGGGMVPGECLSNMNCANDEDCMMGYHCNLALTPPQCEKLYCGPKGTACSESPECAVGLKCLASSCADMSACLVGGDACEFSDDCCGKSCTENHCCTSCPDLLKGNGDLMTDCPGSKQSIQETFGCGCEGPCQSACLTSLCKQPVPIAASAACMMCLQQSCSVELAMCMAD